MSRSRERSRERSTRSSRATDRARAAALAAAGYMCQLRLAGVCIGAAPLHATGTTPAGELAHLIPLAVDPTLEWVVSNHRAACRPCNRRQGPRLLHRAPSLPSPHWTPGSGAGRG